MTRSVLSHFRARISSLGFRAASAFVGAILIVTLGVAALEFRNQRDSYLEDVLESERLRAESAGRDFERWLDHMRRDVTILSETPPIAGILRASASPDGVDSRDQTDLETWKLRLQHIFTAFLKTDPDYAQLRFIGVADDGLELVRAEVRDGLIVTVEGEDLQQKGRRDYFLDGLDIRPDEIDLSKITLNREHGVVETPLNPMLRVMKGVFASDGSLFGFITINARAERIIGALRAAASSSSRAYLVNDDGDFLLHPDPAKTFGFDLGQRFTWRQDFPDLPDAATLSVGDGVARDRQEVGDHYLTARRIPLSRSDPGAAVHLIYEMRQADVRAWGTARISRVTLVTSLIAIALGTLVMVYLKRLMRPLKRLSESAAAIGNGDLDVLLPDTRVQELATLVAAFRQMVADIRARDLALEKSNAEIRQLNEELRERLEASDQRAALATEAVGIALWDVEPQSGRIQWDDLSPSIFGLAAAGMPGDVDGLLEFIHPDDRANVAALIEAARYEGQEFAAVFRIVQSDAGLRYLDARAGRVTDGQGKLTLLRGVVIDVTSERQTALEYRVLNEELSSFAYAVSHDLRAPLRSMNGFAEALTDEYADTLDDVAKGYITRIANAAVRMGVLIDDILALTRISKTEITRQTVDLSRIAAEVVDELRSGEPGRNVTVEIMSDLTVITDPGMARIVLWNLLGNAWKYSSEESPAEIVFDRVMHQGRSILRVRDNGIGFDMAYADKLYRPFQRLHSDQRIQGTGIGLATVSRAIGRLGGRIAAESEVGRGATFYFTL
ncbi:MAG: ATP-binding protein [Thalassobaculaceae bacterium]|nr:ATP-binding protein [Thalassobaculaceae bacterium]